MYGLLRPLLFALDPHTAHATASLALAPVEHVGVARSLVRSLARVDDPRLRVEAMGLTFPNPIGVAGGFDKNATRARSLAALGFGFVEVGTVTTEPQGANPAPNMFRLPLDRALINRLGFPNEGSRAVCDRIARFGGSRAMGVPLGVSIGKSRSVPTEPIDGVIADYLASFHEARRVADFVVVNVSSPNTKNLRALQSGDTARALLGALMEANDSPKVPLLVKIAPDLDDESLAALLDATENAGLAGVVATNTTLSREGLVTPADEVERIGAGGLSGPPLQERARKFVHTARIRLGENAAIIGVGGVETAHDATLLLEAGADLVQLYTGFIYGGPLIATRIARGLARRLDERGLASVRELRAS